MTALAATSSSLGAHATWLPATEAAKRLGISSRRLRQIAPGLQARGLAAKSGSAWLINPDHHPALREAGARPQTSPADVLAASNKDDRQLAARKLEAVDRFVAWRDRPGVNTRTGYTRFRGTLADLELDPGLRTIETWTKRVERAADRNAALMSLLDTRGRRPSERSCDEAAWKMFLGLYLHQNQLSLRHCWQIVRGEAHERGWDWPALRTVHEMAKRRLTPEQVCRAREGVEAWQRRFMASVEQDAEASEAGEMWEGDHARLDFDARVKRTDGGVVKWVAVRLWLTAWIDRRSRRLMGWRIGEHASSRSIRESLVSALEDESVSPPKTVKIDNGKDYASRAITGSTKSQRRSRKDDAEEITAGVLNMLGIGVSFATPYNHNGKARVERAFGVVHGRFCKTFDSWCGSDNKLSNRKETRESRKAIDSMPTVEEVRERFTRFAQWYNTHADHAVDDLVVDGHRLSRDGYYHAMIPQRSVLPDREALRFLRLQFSTRPIKPTKNGVGIKLHGRTVRYGQHDPHIREHIASGVAFWVGVDPDDISTAYVFDQSWRLVCEADQNELHGRATTSEDLKAAIARQREQNRRAKQPMDVAAMTRSAMDLAIEKQREREVAETREREAQITGQDAEHIAPLRIVETPFDGQAARERETEHLAKAAGAEELTFEPQLPPASIDQYDDDDQDEVTFDFDAYAPGAEADSPELTFDAGIDDQSDEEDDEEFDVIGGLAG